MKKIIVTYSTGGKILAVDDNSAYFEQENESLQIDAKITTDKKVRAYIKAPNGNSDVTGAIEPSEGVYSIGIKSDFMAKGTLYVGFEIFEDESTYIERFEPLKVYVDSFVNPGEGNTDNVYVVTVEIADIETLSPDGQAYVENVGNQKDVKLKFGIPQGVKGNDGNDGKDGYTPVAGKDFYTEEEKSQFVEEVKKAFPIDGELSEISKNPVQNKVVANYLLNALVPLWSRATDWRPDRLVCENQIYVNQDGEVETIYMCEYVEEHGMVETAKEFKDKKAREMIGSLPSTEQEYNPKSEKPQSGQAVAQAIAQLLGSAPENLDTLEELAKALNEDENFSAKVLAEIAKKVDNVDGKGLSTNDFTDKFKTMLENVETKIEIHGSDNIPTSSAVFNLILEMYSELFLIPDSKLSETSENPVQNKVVTAEINNINTLLDIYSMLYQQLTGTDEDGAVLRRYFHISEKEEPAESPFYAETDYLEPFWMENPNFPDGGEVPYFVRFKDTKAREMLDNISKAGVDKTVNSNYITIDNAIIGSSIEVETEAEKITYCGNNLVTNDVEKVVKTISFTSKYTAIYSGSPKCVIVRCKPNTTYSVKKFENIGNIFRVISTAEKPEVGVMPLTYNEGTTEIQVTTPSDANWLAIMVANTAYNDPIENVLNITMCVESAEMPTEHEPFIGGTIDVVDGKCEIIVNGTTNIFTENTDDILNVTYKIPIADSVNTLNEKMAEIVGDIETALDSIIAIQTELLGGDAE